MSTQRIEAARRAGTYRQHIQAACRKKTEVAATGTQKADVCSGVGGIDALLPVSYCLGKRQLEACMHLRHLQQPTTVHLPTTVQLPTTVHLPYARRLSPQSLPKAAHAHSKHSLSKHSLSKHSLSKHSDPLSATALIHCATPRYLIRPLFQRGLQPSRWEPPSFRSLNRHSQSPNHSATSRTHRSKFPKSSKQRLWSKR